MERVGEVVNVRFDALAARNWTLGLRVRELTLKARVEVVVLVVEVVHGRARLRSACSAKREGTSCIFSRCSGIDGLVMVVIRTG